MIRIGAVSLIILVMSIYAYRDWYKSLCCLVTLMAVVEHPDLPRSLGGIPGMNLWNVLFLNVVAAWAITRGREGLKWNVGWKANLLLLFYFIFIVIGVRRLMGEVRVIEEEVFLMQGSRIHIQPAGFIYEYLFNTFKWAVPGVLMMDGCRSRSRFLLGIASILALYLLLSIQVIKWIPPWYLLDADALTRRALKILDGEIGYHRVNMSMMLAGASWALFAAHVLVEKRYRLLPVMAAAGVFYAQALTAGRTGYVTWAVLALILCSMRWRKMLLVVPFAVLTVVFAAPGVVDRMLQGFRAEEGQMVGSGGEVDAEAVTAGRSKVWPHVIEKIEERPWVGYGRLAMYHTGLVRYSFENLGEPFGHPHNAFLELLLDNGLLGFAPIFGFYVLVLWNALQLFHDSRSPIFVATGGIALSLVGAFLVATVGGQTFYPREESVGMWCAMGLALRVGYERKRLLAQAAAGSRRASLLELRPSAALSASRPLGGRITSVRPAAPSAPDSWDSQLWARS